MNRATGTGTGKSGKYVAPTYLELAIDALRKDLQRDDGPQISTVRNYNFAILPYRPHDEFKLRRKVDELCGELRDAGWAVGEIKLHALLMRRIRAMGDDVVASIIRREKANAGKQDPWRGLHHVKERIVSAVEGPDGLAADVVREIAAILDANPEVEGRTAIFLSRAGALYPFFRTSALLKHVAGQTRNVPVILLYPGTSEGDAGLSFMGILPADRDYRPRIYR